LATWNILKDQNRLKAIRIERIEVIALVLRSFWQAIRIERRTGNTYFV
jgi:hypothetical protein